MILSEEQETQAREIAEQEVRRFAGLLAEESVRIFTSKGGLEPVSPEYAVRAAQKRYDAGEVSE